MRNKDKQFINEVKLQNRTKKNKYKKKIKIKAEKMILL